MAKWLGPESNRPRNQLRRIPMGASVHSVGFDIHEKMVAYCVKTKGGKIRDEGTIRATRQSKGNSFYP
jgi:hypothetical protein